MKRAWLIQNICISFLSLAIFFSLGEIITRKVVGSPLLTKPDNILFWRYKKGQTGCQKLYSPISKVDSNGFRCSGMEYDPALPSIYVGGDSYAWGEGVLDTETFAASLQGLLDARGMHYNVLNGGVPGYGIEQIIRRMEIESEQYNCKYAIFLWVEEDINRLRDVSPERKKRFLRDYRLRSMFRYSAFLKMIKERVFDKFLQKDIGFGYYGDENLEYAKTHSFDEKIKSLTPEIINNVRFLNDRGVVPIWAFMTVPSGEFKNYLSSLADSLSVELIDPEMVYRSHFQGLKNMATEHSGHFKPEVYRLLAGEIFDRVFQGSDQ
ncbi:hypothetical protein ACFL2G_01525 [Candidatus Omnitrophota bacterium]